MLLHGWMVSADLNWHAAYEPLAQAGYRVLAIDHRGHGRGMRAMAPFRLADCAADAVAVVRHLGLAPATFVGYSMGGTIAQLIARDHRDAVCGDRAQRHLASISRTRSRSGSGGRWAPCG